MKKINFTTILPALLLMLAFFNFSHEGFSQTWSEIQPEYNYWKSSAISSDGGIILAANGSEMGFGGLLKKSSNGGSSWTNIGPTPDNIKNWQSLAMSANGTYMMAAESGGRVYRSTDGGANWTETQPAGDVNGDWHIALSDNGQTSVAANFAGRLYKSTDYGDTWTEMQPEGDNDKWWYVVAVSGDGNTFVAGVYSSESVYVSHNAGTDWSSSPSAGNGKAWQSVDLSYDGQTVYVISMTDVNPLKSTDGLASWTIMNAGNSTTNIAGVSCSSDGQTLAMVSMPEDKIFYSTNGGSSWQNHSIAVTSPVHFEGTSVSVSQDGRTILGLTRDFEKNKMTMQFIPHGRIYKCVLPPPPTVSWYAVGSWSKVLTTTFKQFNCVSGSSDGSIALAGEWNYRLYKSANTGASWTEVQPAGNAGKLWQTVSVSGNGLTMLAAVYNGRLYKSADGGTTWNESRPAGDANKNWYSVSVSSDGLTIFAAVYGGRLYKSSDGGSTWSEPQPAGAVDKNWQSVSVSANGSIIFAAVNGGRLYKSSDGGSTWSEPRPAGDANKGWQTVSVSGNGLTMAACVNGGRLYKSADGGASWSEPQPAGAVNKNWYGLGVSSSGNIMLAGVDDWSSSRLYKSADGGTTWSEVQPAGNADRHWQSASISSDGSVMYAAAMYDGIYRWSIPPVFSSVTSVSASATGNITATNGANATVRGAIIYPYTGTNKELGDADVTNISASGDFGTGTYAVSFSALTPNTRYDSRAYATNGGGTGYSVRGDFRTLANVPSAPTVNNPALTTLDVTVNVNLNPIATEFAINETSTTKFVQADGTLGATAVWQTASVWGTKTVTGLTAATNYTFKVKARNGDNAETAYSSTTSLKTATTLTWDGSESTDWNTAANWNINAIPTVYDNVIIPDVTNDPVISSGIGADCNNLTVNSGGSLTVQSGGSLITNGTITNNGTINLQKTISDGQYHLVSSPIANATANTFLGEYLQTWDEPTATWSNIEDPLTSLVVAKGYSLWGVAKGDHTYTFTGTPNTGNQSIAITHTEVTGVGYDGANLLGNPYPSAIDWDNLNETYGAVYFYNGTAYVSWNAGGDGSQYIPPMQAFFIVTPASGTFSLTNSSRTHTGATGFYKSGNEKTIENGLILQASNGLYNDELYLLFNEEASPDFELVRDAWKFTSSAAGLSQIWSVCSDGNLSIDVRPDQETIQLGFSNDQSGTYNISLKEMAGISKATLEDTKLNIFHNLQNGKYEFTWDKNDTETRFKLHLNTVGIEETPVSGNLWISGNTLYINAPKLSGQSGLIEVYNASGQKLMSKTLIMTELSTLELNCKGFVIVKLTAGQEVMTVKGILMK